jgi:hypothetical protein
MLADLIELSMFTGCWRAPGVYSDLVGHAKQGMTRIYSGGELAGEAEGDGEVGVPGWSLINPSNL